MNKDLLYQIALTRVPNVGDVHAKALINQLGTAEAVFKTPRKQLETLEGIGTVRADTPRSGSTTPIFSVPAKAVTESRRISSTATRAREVWNSRRIPQQSRTGSKRLCTTGVTEPFIPAIRSSMMNELDLLLPAIEKLQKQVDTLLAGASEKLDHYAN